MKTKIIMDSGKEYIVDGYLENIVDRCYNYTSIPMSNNRMTMIKNSFAEIMEGIVINPSHISSIEVVEK